MQYKNKRRVIIGLFLIFLGALYFFKNISFSIRAVAFIVSILGFYFLDHAFDVKFKLRHYIFFIVISSAGFLLSPLYFLSESYDKILHLTMPIFGSILIFFIINKLDIKFQWKLLITFTAIFSYLAIQEIAEYVIDYFWDFKLQGVYLRDITGLEKYKIVLDKNDDTMIDMILGLAGSFIFTIGKIITHSWNKKFAS